MNSAQLEGMSKAELVAFATATLEKAEKAIKVSKSKTTDCLCLCGLQSRPVSLYPNQWEIWHEAGGTQLVMDFIKLNHISTQRKY